MAPMPLLIMNLHPFHPEDKIRAAFPPIRVWKTTDGPCEKVVCVCLVEEFYVMNVPFFCSQCFRNVMCVCFIDVEKDELMKVLDFCVVSVYKS